MTKKIQFLLCPFALATLAGCMAMNEPKIAYYGEERPLSETAVFAVQGEGKSDNGKLVLGSVEEVDGRSMRVRFMNKEYPYWVRVLPGEHDFKILYYKYGRYAEKTVHVSDMKPRHVYVAQLLDYNDKYNIQLVDTGENSTFTEHSSWGTSTKSGDFQAKFN